MLRFLPAVLDHFLETWFSPICPICANEIWMGHERQCCTPFHFIENPVCIVCGFKIESGQDTCGKCFNVEFRPIEQIRSLLWYQESAKALIHMVKFQGRFEWFNVFLNILNLNNFPFSEEGFHLVPVPVHRKKFLKRGFNQSEILAEHISDVISLPINTGLRKNRETPPQSALNQNDRKLNLLNAFEWDTKRAIPEKIILIDDVYTTGETLSACAKVLRSVGVKRVLAWTLFRTPQI